jgi:hypothetical protein
MFEETSTKVAPWEIVPGNHKWYARVHVCEHVADVLGEDVDVSIPPLDPKFLRDARKMLGNLEIDA